MVNTNTAYLFSLPGFCKITTIIFVIISISLGGHAYENSLYNIVYNLEQIFKFVPISDLPGLGRERFFLAILGMTLTISVISLLCHSMNEGFMYDRKLKLMDIVYHGLAALFLLIAGSLIIASARKINKDVCHADWTTIPPFTTTGNPYTDEPKTTPSSTSIAPSITTEASTTTEPSTESSTSQKPEPTTTTTTTTTTTATTTTTTPEPTTDADSTSLPPPGKLGEPVIRLVESMSEQPEAYFQFLKVKSVTQYFSTLADDEPDFKCQYRAEKEVAGTFAILGSLLFVFVAVVLFLRLNSLPEPSPGATMHEVAL